MKIKFFPAAVFAWLILTAVGVRANTLIWNNLAGGNWSNPANWSPAQIPGPGDTVVITNDAAYTVTLDVDASLAGLVVGAPGGSHVQTLAGSGVNFTINGPATINPQGAVNLTAVTLGGTMTLMGNLNLSAGTLTNGSSLTVSPTGVLDLAGVGAFTFDSPLTNHGTVNWQGGNLQVNNDNTTNYAGGIWNLAQWNIECSANLQTNLVYSSYEIFHNWGTLTVGGTTTIGTYLDNTGGTVTAQKGVIQFADGGNLAGRYLATAAATAIYFTGGTVYWSGAPDFEGNVQIVGGTVVVNGSTPGLVASGVTISGLSNVTGSATLTNCTLNGNETVNSSLYLAGGTLTGGGSLTVTPNGVLNFEGPGTVDLEGPLTNNGTVNWQGGNIQLFNNNTASYGGIVWNIGQWNAACSLTLYAYFDTGYEIFHNWGTLTKSGVGGATTIGTYLDNTGGTVTAQKGSIQFADGGNLAGRYLATAAETAIYFTGGTLYWSGTPHFEGNVLITGGTVVVNGSTPGLVASGVYISGLSNVTGSASLTNCTLSGNETVNSYLYLAGGTLTGGGSLTVAPNGVLNLVGPETVALEGPLTNNGTVNWQGGNIQLYNNQTATFAGAIWNIGQWNAEYSSTLYGYFATGYEIFHNWGTLTKIEPTGTTTIKAYLDNTGTLDVENGAVSCLGGESFTAGSTLDFGLNSLTSFGSLELSGAAALAGNLTAHLNAGYVPAAVGDTFPLVTYGSKTGAFTFENLPAGAVWQHNYSPQAVNLVVAQLPVQVGSDAIVLEAGANASTERVVTTPANSVWTASSSVSWLHLDPSMTSGNGSRTVQFHYDANPGAPRTGTLTIGGRLISVSQAGKNYIPAAFSIVVPDVDAVGLALNNAGNLYIASEHDLLNYTGVPGYQFNWGDSAGLDTASIQEFNPVSGNVSTLVGPLAPMLTGGLAVDGAGDVYFGIGSDSTSNTLAVCEWNAGSGSISTVLAYAQGPFFDLTGMAIDGPGNLYFSDADKVYQYTPAGALNPIWNPTGSGYSAYLASGAGGSLYAGYGGGVFVQQPGSGTSNFVFGISGQANTTGVGVDGSGNVYATFPDNKNLVEWSAATGQLSYKGYSELDLTGGGAVVADPAGNVFVADSADGCVKELPHAFVDPTPKFEGPAAGNDFLAPVVPATLNLVGGLYPTTDQPWLNIAGVVNGVVNFGFTANTTGASRTGHVIVLGQPISVTQPAAPALAATARWEGPAAGGDSVILAANPLAGAWAATANNSWLHVNPSTANGTSSTNVIFSFDANPSAAGRTGTLTIDGLTLTVSQAGSNYIAVSSAITLAGGAAGGLSFPEGVVAFGDNKEGAADLLIADTGDNAIKTWSVGGGLSTLVPAGTVPDFQPTGIALDGSGNVYATDYNNQNAVYEYPAATHVLTALPATEYCNPQALAADRAGNMYIASDRSAVFEYTAPNTPLTYLAFTGLILTNAAVATAYDAAGFNDTGVAVDAAGNVYIAAENSSPGAYEWSGANQPLAPIPVDNSPTAVAVDGAGNSYFMGQHSIEEMTVATKSVSTVYSSSDYLAYGGPAGLSLDTWNNLYFTSTGTGAGQGQIRELRFGLLDPRPRLEPGTAGTDFLPPVLPDHESLNGPFAPTSSSPWLTINGVVNGVIEFSFTANNLEVSRTGYIRVLGQAIAITQGSGFTLGFTTNRLEGPVANSDTVMLGVNPSPLPWTATPNASWLHVATGSQSGNQSARITFSFDANAGATRTGTITIGDQTLTVVQAGATYVQTILTTNLVTTGLSGPTGVAVDGAGDLFIADTGDNAVKKLPASGSLVTLAAGFSAPQGVAVDPAGNVYIGDTGNNTVDEIPVGTTTVNALVTAGLTGPTQLAVDLVGNVFIADTGANAIKEVPAGGALTTLLDTGLASPQGLTVDVADNLYISDTGHNVIKELPAGAASANNLILGIGQPENLAVDGGGNVALVNGNEAAIWEPVNNTVWDQRFNGLASPMGVAVDGAGNVYVADTGHNRILERPYAFVDARARLEPINAGNDQLPVVLPASANLSGPFAPASNEPWLAITGVTNGVVSFAFTANLSGGNRSAGISILGQAVAVTQSGAGYILGTTTRVEGPAAGGDSDILVVSPGTATWTASANAPWLHLSTANQSGTGGTNVMFTFDANTGGPRNGTLTIAGQTVTVYQAGARYVPAGAVATVNGINNCFGIAVDAVDNLYLANYYGHAIDEWTAASQNVSPLVNLGSSSPVGVAVDAAGNLYMTTIGPAGQLQKWTVADGNLTIVANGLNGPAGVAVDTANNAYFAVSGNNSIEKETAAGTVSTLVGGLNYPEGVALDIAGNVYEADYYSGRVEEVAASGSLTTAVPYEGSTIQGVAVDGGGDIYTAGYRGIGKWYPATRGETNLVPGQTCYAVALDNAGNVFYSTASQILELPNAYLDATGGTLPDNGGNGSLPAVVPSTIDLTGLLAPVSDSSWLTINGTAGGVVSYSFTANNGPARTANITLLGQTITLSQGSPSTYYLNASTAFEESSAGDDAVVLSINPNHGTWTATTTASWLHFTGANQSGIGSGRIVFGFDANPGATRTATATIGGQTLTVTQAGSTYSPAGSTGVILSGPGLVFPYGVAVDAAGNVYVVDNGNKKVKEWVAATGGVRSVASAGLIDPTGVAVDTAGDVFIADGAANEIFEVPAGGSLTPLVTAGLNNPTGLAMDVNGNLFIANSGDKEIDELTAGGAFLRLVTTGLNDPVAVAVDALDDVFIADAGANAIYELPFGGTLQTLINTGLDDPTGVAVDHSGNVYIADTGDNAIYEIPLGGGLTFLAFDPNGVAVDASGNLYFSDSGLDSVQELQHAAVDATPKYETYFAGSDTLPSVVPATANLAGSFAPTSDQSWLTITGTANGVVSFAFTENTGPSRTAHVSLLGQSISVMQAGISTYALGRSAALEGASAGTDSVLLAVTPDLGTWSAATTNTWLHLNPAFQSGTGGTNVVFSFDANTRGTRTGSLTIGGQVLSVTQAGSPYVSAGTITPLTAGVTLDLPQGVAVDSNGNVYFADNGTRSIYEWIASQNVITNLVSTGLANPMAVAVDVLGNVYIADTGANTIYEYSIGGILIPVIASGLNEPTGLALDANDNLYIADSGDATVYKWNGGSLVTVAGPYQGLSRPTAVALDTAGNVFIADSSSGWVSEWPVTGAGLQSVVFVGSFPLTGLAVDGGGNVFVSSPGLAGQGPNPGVPGAVYEWVAASGALNTLVNGTNAVGVAVDSTGNIYFSDNANAVVDELPYVFVDPTPRSESIQGGSDSLPVVLPATVNLTGLFAPTVNQPWVSINSVAGGVVGFSYAANNTAASKTADINLFGAVVPILQAGNVTPPALLGGDLLGNGAYQFTFYSDPGASFTVFATTNLALPLSQWENLGTAVQNPAGSGQFEFTDPGAADLVQRFYNVRSQ